MEIRRGECEQSPEANFGPTLATLTSYSCRICTGAEITAACSRFRSSFFSLTLSAFRFLRSCRYEAVLAKAPTMPVTSMTTSAPDISSCGACITSDGTVLGKLQCLESGRQSSRSRPPTLSLAADWALISGVHAPFVACKQSLCDQSMYLIPVDDRCVSIARFQTQRKASEAPRS